MLNPISIITEICNVSKNYFPDSSFHLTPINIIQNKFYKYYSTGSDSSKAINNKKNTLEEINVVKWFDDFWIYMVITFNQADKKTINTFFTLSVFEGSSQDNIKNQLFRAEWDTYNDNRFHPQPHWHFYSNGRLENLVKEFSELLTEEETGFIDLINEEKFKGIDINKMHFAMSAHWDKENGHIHGITDGNELLNWYKGLMSHIKFQLEYAL